MKKFLIPVVFTLCAFVMTSAMVADGAITREGDAVVVDTKTIVKGVVGYNGSTHVKIYIKKDKIEKIVPQPNRESPQYFAKAKKVLEKFKGKSVDKASAMKVDGVTGATISSDALTKTVQKGLKYYKEQK